PPSLGLHGGDQLLESPAGHASSPVGREVASDEEGRRGTERGAGEVQNRSPHGTEQRASGQTKNRSGNEENRRDGEERDMGERRPRPRSRIAASIRAGSKLSRWKASQTAAPAMASPNRKRGREDGRVMRPAPVDRADNFGRRRETAAATCDR